MRQPRGQGRKVRRRSSRSGNLAGKKPTPSRKTGGTRARRPATDSSLLRGLLLGVAPLAVLGLVAGLAMFYDSADESAEPAAGSIPPAGAEQIPPQVPLYTPTPEPSVSLPPDLSELSQHLQTTSPRRTAARTPAKPGGRTGPTSRPRPPAVREVERRVADFRFKQADNFWGPVERNSSNGEKSAGDGGTITIEGQRFGHGLGVHAPARVQLDLGGRCSSFSGYVGLDDEEGSNPRRNVGAVVFAVSGDGRTLYRSPVVQPWDDPDPVRVDVSGVRVLTLGVDDLGDTRNDHADWAATTLRCRE